MTNNSLSTLQFALLINPGKWATSRFPPSTWYSCILTSLLTVHWPRLSASSVRNSSDTNLPQAGKQSKGSCRVCYATGRCPSGHRQDVYYIPHEDTSGEGAALQRLALSTHSEKVVGLIPHLGTVSEGSACSLWVRMGAPASSRSPKPCRWGSVWWTCTGPLTRPGCSLWALTPTTLSAGPFHLKVDLSKDKTC